MNMLGLRDLVLIAPNPSSFQQQGQQQQQEHHGNNLPLMPSSSALSVGLGIFPLLTTTPCMPQPHHHHHHQHINDVHQECNNNNSNNNNNNNNNNSSNNYWNLKMCPEVMSNNDSARKGGGIMINNMEENEENNGDNSIYGGGVGGDFRVCQDCGNRAKKDCSFRRCRTCCKGRGFDCTTHVKSTWVPASRRRDRDMVVAADGDGDGDDGGGASSSGAKRPRALLGSSSQNVPTNSHSSTSNNATITKSFDTSSYQQDAGFKQSLPGHVRAPAVFRCHRMAAIGNGEDELAYLATVHIKGHVFRGFLYDHGVDGKNEIPYVSVLQLGNNVSVKNNRECSSSAIGVPTSAYPASAC
ncbi:hypothetical protein RIF29_13700 [Crotalaria pallida]|uniref:Uncharacterized protein n=1 Tax=Crotalaria pallida TaxID=3830 RepID=A0AAN9IPN9_CROPI